MGGDHIGAGNELAGWVGADQPRRHGGQGSVGGHAAGLELADERGEVDAGWEAQRFDRAHGQRVQDRQNREVSGDKAVVITVYGQPGQPQSGRGEGAIAALRRPGTVGKP